jgi:hypothetical protein
MEKVWSELKKIEAEAEAIYGLIIGILLWLKL